MRRLLPFIIMVSSFGVSFLGHQRADQVRNVEEDLQRVYIPSGEAIRVASMGYHTAVADLLWVRSVLNFAEILSEPVERDQNWLGGMLTSVAVLDPMWRTVYFHGGGMLRIVGDVEASDALFTLGMENLPEDPYFPFSIAMNAYLFHRDMEKASRYLNQAASLPGAPEWYRSAAAGFLNESGQRLTAIRYLREQYEEATEEGVRESLRNKLLALQHEELSDRLGQRRQIFLQEMGRDITSAADLAPLPDDPYGAGWIISVEGDVVSAQVEENRALRSRRVGRRMLMQRAWWVTE